MGKVGILIKNNREETWTYEGMLLYCFYERSMSTDKGNKSFKQKL